MEELSSIILFGKIIKRSYIYTNENADVYKIFDYYNRTTGCCGTGGTVHNSSRARTAIGTAVDIRRDYGHPLA